VRSCRARRVYYTTSTEYETDRAILYSVCGWGGGVNFERAPVLRLWFYFSVAGSPMGWPSYL